MKRNLAALLCIFVLLLSGCMFSPGRARTIHVLVIATDYKNSSWTDLKGTVADAFELAACFAEFGAYTNTQVNIIPLISSGGILYGNAVTESTIKDQLNLIRDTASAKDITLIHFSGHGGLVSGSREPVLAMDENNMLLRFSNVMPWIEEIPGEKILLLDSCQSGAFISQYPGEVNGSDATHVFQEAWLSFFSHIEKQYPSVHILSAARASQFSYDYEFPNGEWHGLMSWHLLEGLGWVHDPEFTTSVSVGFDNSIVIEATGYFGTAPRAARKRGQLTLDDLFVWIEKNVVQKPQTAQISGGPDDILLFSW